jgi:8-oxo-dGTP diphosphatase
MERVNDPNKGLLSPAGGKLHLEDAESPVQCAVREAEEECGIKSGINDWNMIGLVTEKDYPGIGNIMIFLMQYNKALTALPPDSNEGKFCFIPPEKIKSSNIPETDKLYLWNLVLDEKRKFFSLRLDCTKTPFECIIEQ